MMPFLLAEYASLERVLPLYVCLAGSHEQKQIVRPDGFHAHQLFLCRSGKGSFLIRGEQRIVLSQGDVLLLPAHIPHSYCADAAEGSWELGFTAFGGTAAEALMASMSRLSLTAIPCASFAKLWKGLEALWQLLSQNVERSYWEASRHLYGILTTMLEAESPASRQSAPPLAAGDGHPGLQAAIQFLHDHYNERLQLTNVARSIGYSVQHFHRLFAEQYGTTPQQYIIQLRMLRSVQLFRDYPGIAVDKVAQQLGLETSYFIRLFKRHYGITPRQYVIRNIIR